MSWTFAWENQIRSRNLKSSMHLPIPTPHHTVPGQKPEAEASTSAGTDMETGVGDRRVRFRGERDSPRHHLDVSSDRELMEKRVGKCRDELRQVNPLFLFILPKQARPRYNRRAQPLQVVTHPESDST